MVAALQKIKPGLSATDARQMLQGLPKTILSGSNRQDLDAAAKALATAGAKTSLAIVPEGPDLARGWGKRRTVAEDFLYDDPVLLGAQRVGPDLANAGVRLPDLNWQLCHLYWPRSEVKNSGMPAYQFLFEKLPAGPVHSPEALVFPRGANPDSRFEIIPRPEALALAAYLVSLRADAPLFVAPVTLAPTAAAATNAASAAGSTTNAPAGAGSATKRCASQSSEDLMTPDRATTLPLPVETAEPKAAEKAVPVVLVVLLLVLLFGGMVYFDQRGAWFKPEVYTPYISITELTSFQPPTGGIDLEQGRAVYERVCGLCHNSDGMGKPNQAPPFAGSEWVLGSANRMIRIPLSGLNGSVKVKDVEWSLSMPAMGAALSDEDLSAVLTYIRSSWGNKATPITAEQVKAVRAEVGNRPMWTVEQLNAIP